MGDGTVDSRNRCQLGYTVAIGMSFLLSGCTGSPAAERAGAEPRLQHAVTALERQTDADSLAAAALLGQLEHDDTAMALLTRAIAAAPERPDLVWLQAQICSRFSQCDPESIERHLRELDPTNGIGWMGALARAKLSNSEEAKNTALTAIGNSERVDIYWTTLIARLSRATADTGVMGLHQAEISIIGVLSARVIPSYDAVDTACKGERLQHVNNVDVCRGVAKAFERGDTYITEMIGVAIAKRVWPEDSADWEAANEARRVYTYRSRFWPALDIRDETHAQKFLTFCAQNRREQDVLRAQLIAAGKNPNPPPD
jgi:hypothetical protein